MATGPALELAALLERMQKFEELLFKLEFMVELLCRHTGLELNEGPER